MGTALLEDERLVKEVLSAPGGEAFRILVGRYADRIASFLTRMLGPAAPAADLTQETFLRAYSRLAQYNPKWSLATWLFGIATNLARDHLRRQKLRQTQALPTALPDGVNADPARKALCEEQVQRVRKALLALPDTQREVVVLHVYEQLSYAEVGCALGVPEATARSRMRYAVGKLARLLEEKADE